MKIRYLRTAIVIVVLAYSASGVRAQKPSKEQKEQAKALASQPIIPLTRGGSLGLPGSTGELSFGAEVGLGAPDLGLALKAFGTAGRLAVAPLLAFEVGVENVQIEVPIAAFAPESVTVRPLPRLQLRNLQSLGLRALVGEGVGTRSSLILQAKVLKCVGARTAGWPAGSATKAECAKIGIRSDGSNQTNLEAWKAALSSEMNGWSAMIGLRFLYDTGAPFAEQPQSVGPAAELAIRYSQAEWAVFLSGSYVWRPEISSTSEEGLRTEGMELHRVSGTLGGYYQWLDAADSAVGQLLPRIGVNVTASRNFWHNRFADETQAQADISGWQLEGTLYVSGHFTNGFGGYLALSMVRPFGHSPEPQFLIRIAPVFGASTAGEGE